MYRASMSTTRTGSLSLYRESGMQLAVVDEESLEFWRQILSNQLMINRILREQLCSLDLRPALHKCKNPTEVRIAT